MSNNTLSTIESILSLGGTLSSSLTGWGHSASKVDGFITSINLAAAQGDWAQVATLANDINMLDNLSQSSRDIVSALSVAARNNLRSGTAVGAPGLEMVMQSSEQQLVTSLTAQLHAQVTQESSGILSGLTHIRWWHSQGTSPSV